MARTSQRCFLFSELAVRAVNALVVSAVGPAALDGAGAGV
jgi:hypothetical protein